MRERGGGGGVERRRSLHFLRRASRLASAARTLSSVGAAFAPAAPEAALVAADDDEGARMPDASDGSRGSLLALVAADPVDAQGRAYTERDCRRDDDTRSDKVDSDALLPPDRASAPPSTAGRDSDELSDRVPSFLLSVWMRTDMSLRRVAVGSSTGPAGSSALTDGLEPTSGVLPPTAGPRANARGRGVEPVMAEADDVRR